MESVLEPIVIAAAMIHQLKKEVGIWRIAVVTLAAKVPHSTVCASPSRNRSVGSRLELFDQGLESNDLLLQGVYR